MADQIPPNENARSRAGKSVRWTGQDYFSYSGASGNRTPRASNSGSNNDDAFSESSNSESSDDEEDEENDEHAANVRAATRANTWFNRLRQEEGATDELPAEEDDTLNLDHANMGNMQLNASAGPAERVDPLVPQIQVSQHPEVNPYAHIMDIGTEVSGGLAPGGGPNDQQDFDPIDQEYRERRNRLLASMGTHSQPSSPQLEAVEPLDDGEGIPLQTLAPVRRTESTEEPDLPTHYYHHNNSDQPPLPPPPRDLSENSTPQSLSESMEQDERDETAKEAEMLRQKLASAQSERVHHLQRVIALRQESLDSSRSRPSLSGHRRQRSEASAASRESESSSIKQQNEEAELRRLEEIARQEAEEHAKLLVQSHLASNLLKPNTNNDGYVENPRYLLDDGMLDDDIIPSEEELARRNRMGESSKDANENDNSVDQSKISDVHRRRTTMEEPGNNTDGSSLSSDNLKNEKDGAKAKDSAAQNDNSDSDSDSEDERKQVNLRGDPDYIPPPKKVKEGVLGSLLRLYAGQEEADTSSITTGPSPVTSPAGTPSGTPLGSPGLPSPGGSDNYTSNEYPESTYAESSGGTTTGGSISGNSFLAPGNLPQGHKKWKRPQFYHTRSSEDVLGRETKGRPKWYKSPSSSHTPSISQLASSGLTAAGGAASNVASAAMHPQRPYSHSNGLKKVGKSLHHLANESIEFTGAGRAPKTPEEQQAFKEKEARKRAKKESQKRKEKETQKRKEKEKALKKARLAEQARITVHIADVLQRQRFLLRLGRALMLFGAPSHRLEEYLRSTARVLEIDCQVLYIPGCILLSFGDATTHTSETKLIRVTQGLNLSKLHATHLIFKEVVHDLMSLEEASSHIDHLLRSKNIYPWWLVVFFYGIACSCCGMFAYGAFWRDIPIIFVLGAGVGFLQFWVQPRSDLYANVFEVTSSILVSFAGRAFGSIGPKSDYVFCFASIVQASLALILPGYIILVGALELQTKNLVAGSVRMFYANIYSLFLSFGITLGSAIFGWIYRGAVTNTQCQHSVDPKWKILFVPAATLFMALVNQAGPRQLPIMVLIGSAGYAVQYFVANTVKAAAFTSAIGAFTMGVIGNLYSRVGHGLAFAAMLPGIFVLVPSGVAAQGSLVAGVKVATQIVNATQGNKTPDNSAQTISDLGNSMTQVAVGIVVGLFAATLVVYPLGFKKKRSGLFTF